MPQPNNFGFGEEAALLKESARKFFAENFPSDRLHAMTAGDHNPERMSEANWDTDLWQQMVELGWTMVAVPEEPGTASDKSDQVEKKHNPMDKKGG